MRKEILAEDFANASKAYTDLQGALMDVFENEPIMSCLLEQLYKLANEYQMAMICIHNAGMTLDEAIKLLS